MENNLNIKKITDYIKIKKSYENDTGNDLVDETYEKFKKESKENKKDVGD